MVEISDDDVKEAVAEWLAKKCGPGQPWDVSVRASTRSTGFGAMERDDPYAVITA
jgi:hypothetical protein